MEQTHLNQLEAESIEIMREVVAECERPAMLYSIGKDSTVMLHLARKAFAPGPVPFPLLHVDTTWEFAEMAAFKDRIATKYDLRIISHVNESARDEVSPFSGPIYTDLMKTEALRQALDEYKFDAAFGGARRDEEKSRAKERIFSFRAKGYRWDPKRQRPELWSLYNARMAKGETMRVFPLSNWTELDIWQYIYREKIEIVPLYFAAERPVVQRNGSWIMVDDDRLPLEDGEEIQMKKVRFRTLGCYPLTGGVESEASSLAQIVAETLTAKTSERQNRSIDQDSGSMERRKKEGYF